MSEFSIQSLRANNPLVLNITNTVVANYVANGLLSLGASPIMSNAPQEMDELVALVAAVALNIGTLTAEQVTAMTLAARAANRVHKPLLLDPVGIGASHYRREATASLLRSARFEVIRGNAGELATLAEVAWTSKGVDAGEGAGDLVAIAETVAQRYHTVAVLTGAVDVVSDGQRSQEIAGGSALFPKITGAGCLHGAVIAAFLALGADPFTAATTACTYYKRAGERAAQTAATPGAFGLALIDALATLE